MMIYSFSLPYMRGGKKRDELAREVGYKTVNAFGAVGEATYPKAASMMISIESLTLMGMLHDQKWGMK